MFCFRTNQIDEWKVRDNFLLAAKLYALVIAKFHQTNNLKEGERYRITVMNNSQLFHLLKRVQKALG